MKYSDQLALWLKKLNYTHCFYVSGGNIMHLQDSFRNNFKCIPVIHEVAAGIAAEYFNETSDKNKKAIALVTAGPGLTNIVTAISGAYLESRDLLIIGGQVKTDDLANGEVIQRGIQEIDGVSIVTPITSKALRIEKPISFEKLKSILNIDIVERKGPIFIEIPLDVQASKFKGGKTSTKIKKQILNIATKTQIDQISALLRKSKRPSILIGGGVSRDVAYDLRKQFLKLDIPIFTTWNGMDRVSALNKNYFGIPNTWGQRHANIIIQQSDLLLALGTRLGLQQTGFNWKEFIPIGDIIQVDIDKRELKKGHPKVKWPYSFDVNNFLPRILRQNLGSNSEWIKFCKKVKKDFPLIDRGNKTRNKYVSPYLFMQKLSYISRPKDVLVPCSSGGVYTSFNQAFTPKFGQKIVSNKGLAAMGYGLSAAIGASFANNKKRIIHLEGDGGFSQNLQEIGTMMINKLNIKSFIFDDSGYASIRMTQKNYFDGEYMGCDIKSGLGIPNWEKLFLAWGLKSYKLNNNFDTDKTFLKYFHSSGPSVFIVPVDPNQTYFPKIQSRVTKTGSMESNPLHRMSPQLTNEEEELFFKFLK